MSTKDLQYLDTKTFLADDILVKVDRASMAHGLEVRVPLLDHEVVEYAMSLEESYHFSTGDTKRLLKRVGERILPDAIVEREKEGFGSPLEELGFIDRYECVLDSSRAVADGVLERSAVERARDQNDNWEKTWLLIWFECWYRQWCCADAPVVPK
jgi:asparagine synthase (glutamine-hydrolysing)